jgi:hypothetical protein
MRRIGVVAFTQSRLPRSAFNCRAQRSRCHAGRGRQIEPAGGTSVQRARQWPQRADIGRKRRDGYKVATRPCVHDYQSARVPHALNRKVMRIRNFPDATKRLDSTERKSSRSTRSRFRAIKQRSRRIANCARMNGRPSAQQRQGRAIVCEFYAADLSHSGRVTRDSHAPHRWTLAQAEI